MSETDRLVDQIRRAFEGDAWHGPSVQELLKEIPAERAAAHPLPGRHSIWELVLHMTAWKDVVIRRLAGDPIDKLPPEQDWPAIGDRSPQAWAKAKEQLQQTHRRLIEAASLLSDAQITGLVPGKPYTAYYLLHGIVQHDLYHAGQIALLR
jgi:uncharacterized damage-inducible protein DinB